MFNGRIQGVGPRYCPSIEDKIDRFADKSRHQLFVEPEGWDTCEIYVNGFSSSLPEDVQYRAMREIDGFENVRMFRPGYAIEYDYFPPTQLTPSLETKQVKNLFFAGQINGTTGYEEAASQGLIAGINAHLAISEKEPFVLKRSEAYIGVLIDDLVNKGTEEPYRMFTSRAEYRILLRQDNADVRLTSRVADIGMLGLESRQERVEKKVERTRLKQKVKLQSVVLRPHVSINDLRKVLSDVDAKLAGYDEEIITSAEITMKYAGYILKEQEMVDKMNRLESVKLYDSFDYHALPSLSIEAREKLTKIRPRTIGQASRISGVSPSDVSVLLIHVGR
ncbi:UNVERIFIED_CONTAM: hypothetical protein GTU68_006950 [Idotea baltica]|nr:hypothetical protein [Idotea baltica]